MRHIKVTQNQPPLRYFLQTPPNRITKFKSKITSLATTHIRKNGYGVSDETIEDSSREDGHGNGKQGNQFKNNRLLIKASSKRGSRLIKFHEITSSQQEPPNIITQQKPEMQINPSQAAPPKKKKQIKKTMTIYSTNNPQPRFSPPSNTQKNLRSISADEDEKKIDEQKEDQINLQYSQSMPESDKNNSDVNFQFQNNNYVDVDPIDDPFLFTAKKRTHSISNSKRSQSNGLRMFEVRDNSGYCADVDDQEADDEEEKGPRKRFKHADQRLLSFLTELNNKKMDIYEQLQQNLPMMKQRYEQFCSKPQKRSIHKLAKSQKEVAVQKGSEGQVQQVEDSRKELKKLNTRLQRIILRRNSTKRLNAVQPIQIELKPKILDLKLQKMLEIVREKNQPEPTFSIPTITPNFTTPQPSPLAPPTLTNLPTTFVSPLFKSAVDSQPQPSKQSNSEISSNQKQSSSQNPSNIFFNRPSIPIINLSFPNALNKVQSDKNKSQVDSNSNSKQNSSSIFGVGVASAAGSAASGNESGKIELFGQKDGGFSFGLFGKKQASDNTNKQIEAKVADKKQPEPQIQKPKEQTKKIQVQPIPTPILTPPTQQLKQPKQPKQPQADKNTTEIIKNEVKKQEPATIQENPFLKKPTVQKELLSGLISNFNPNPIFGSSKNSANIFNLMTQPAPASQPTSSPFGIINSPDKKEGIKNDFSTPTKNMLNTVQQVQNQPNVQPQDDESSMFDESEQSGSKRESSIFGDFSRQSVVTPSPSLFNTVSNNGSFGSSLLNNSQMFQAAQVTQIDYLKSMPKVDIEKSLNLFGRSPSNDQGIFGSVDEGRRKPESKHNKKKSKEQRVYGA